MDGLRFVAIASVLLFHAGDAVARALPEAAVAGSWLLPVLAGGNAGVPLFFALSGFIIGLPFAEHALAGRPPVSIRAYFLRRLTRLEPPYLVNLLLLAVLLALQGEPVRSVVAHFVPSALYQHNLVYGSWSPINFVAWSLEVEVQFYVLAPVLAGVFRWPAGLRRGAIVAAVAGMSIVNAVLGELPPGRYNLSLAAWAHYFLIGFLIADLRATGDLVRPRPVVWGVLGLAAWGALVPIRLGGPLYPLFFPAVAGVAFAATLASPVWRRIFSGAWITAIGGMCYTIYLYHATLMHLAMPWIRVTPEGGEAGRAVAVLALSVIAILGSIPLFVLVERPFMAWRRR